MLLKSAPAFSFVHSHGENLSPVLRAAPARGGNGSIVCVSKNSNSKPLTGVVFEPFEEVKKELMLVPTVPQTSLARHKFADSCEAAINEQIKWVFFAVFEISLFGSSICYIVSVEYNVSYVYHALFAYFDRDNVALKGLAKFFKESSEEERDHAEKLMEYQNKRGGKVKLQSILMPASEFDHAEKGDALYAMELALSLEKLTNEKLLNLHTVAGENNDVQLADFVESEFLTEQVEAIKKISEYVAQLRRLGKGHGIKDSKSFRPPPLVHSIFVFAKFSCFFGKSRSLAFRSEASGGGCCLMEKWLLFPIITILGDALGSISEV
ncbi:hypothetical protein RJ639_003189 [Escallonia herrerae]|uniref:Ferritin n=1 Tax=Escallonia herrerae TaxID=1293975 RepID=A0AA89AZ64_9ASTE|nr:hypothetical protein RJ639_003189 [Escallonia herrerae]